MHDDRTRLANDVERELRGHFPELVFRTVIPRSVRIAEAPSFGLPVMEHAPGSRGSAAYRELATELAERERASTVSVERSHREQEAVPKAQVEVEE
jgi:chromosome partitioning protein